MIPDGRPENLLDLLDDQPDHEAWLDEPDAALDATEEADEEAVKGANPDPKVATMRLLRSLSRSLLRHQPNSSLRNLILSPQGSRNPSTQGPRPLLRRH